MKPISVCLLFALLFVGCTPKDNRTTRLENYLREVHQTQIQPTDKALLVLSGNGCGGCSKQFATLLLNYWRRNDVMLLVTLDPNNNLVDLSPFSADSVPRGLYDKRDRFYDTGLLKSSGVLFFEEAKIDTIIELNGPRLEEQFAYIKGRL